MKLNLIDINHGNSDQNLDDFGLQVIPIEIENKFLISGYSELSSNIEAGEGFWIELKSPANPTNFEIADYGGYSALPQLSSMTSEWNLLGTSKEITVLEIAQAGNFDKTKDIDILE